jgi:hypothetical protein
MEKDKSQLGANAIWDGPVDLSMFPTKKGRRRVTVMALTVFVS